MDGAFAPKGLKFDTAYGCEGCGGALRAQYKCCLRQRAPFGGWRHHLSRWEACHWILSRLSAPYESSSLATPYSGGTMGAGQWPQCEFMTVTEKNHTTGLRPEENRPTALRALEMHPFCRLRRRLSTGKRLTRFSVTYGSLRIVFACHPGGGDLLSTQLLDS